MPKGKKIEVKVGKRYGRLVVLGEAPKKGDFRRFCCECDCGNIVVPRLNSLRSGNSKSCGCLRTENTIKVNTKHGHCKGNNIKKVYALWKGIRQRCLNQKNPSYKDYGDRGIKLCDEWLEYIPFYDWAISHGYQKGLTIERINNDGNYEPSNCTFIPNSEQSKNTRRCIPVSVGGIEFPTVADAARCFGIHRQTAYDRLKKGWTIEKTFKTPPDYSRRPKMILIC